MVAPPIRVRVRVRVSLRLHGGSLAKRDGIPNPPPTPTFGLVLGLSWLVLDEAGRTTGVPTLSPESSL